MNMKKKPNTKVATGSKGTQCWIIYRMQNINFHNTGEQIPRTLHYIHWEQKC